MGAAEAGHATTPMHAAILDILAAASAPEACTSFTRRLPDWDRLADLVKAVPSYIRVRSSDSMTFSRLSPFGFGASASSSMLMLQMLPDDEDFFMTMLLRYTQPAEDTRRKLDSGLVVRLTRRGCGRQHHKRPAHP